MIGSAVQRRIGGTTLTIPYLHSLTLAGASSSGDLDNIITPTPVMRHNGLEVVLRNGLTATPLSLDRAAYWSWPLPPGVDGFQQSSISLGIVQAKFAVLERLISASPMQIGIACGVCEGAAIQDGSGAGWACGIEYPSTTVREVVTWHRGGTWFRTAGGTPNSSTFGVEGRPNGASNGTSGHAYARALDVNYDLLGTGANNVRQTSVIAQSGITHCFIALYWTAAVAGTPSVTFDAAWTLEPTLGYE